MKWHLVLVGVVAMAACAPVTTGGVGTLTTGEPVTGLIAVDGVNQTNSFALTSPAGWSCSSSFGPSPAPGVTTRAVPLTCTDGAGGNLIITGNQFQQQIVGTFQLDNGQSGSVIFGAV